MSQILADLRFACRTLARRPAFTLAAVLTLALGIGANTAIFSVVDAVLLRSLPYRQPERVQWISSVQPDRPDQPFSLPEYLDYQKRTPSFEGLGAFGTISASLTGDGNAERVAGMRVSGNAFSLLGVNAAVGRLLLPEDDRAGHSRVVVISNGLWERRFGADPNVAGKTLGINSVNYTILGVLPKNFVLPTRLSEIAIPLAPDEDPNRNLRQSTSFLFVFGRLKSGVNATAALAEMNGVTAALRREFPDNYSRRLGVRFEPIAHKLAGNYGTSLWVLLVAVALVLFIACANLANLLLARVSTRTREISIRRALGATTWGIVRLLLAESLTLAAAGGALGALAASWMLPLLTRNAPADLPRVAEVSIDGGVLAFAAGISLLTGILFGLAPAWQMSRRQALDAINDGKGTSESASSGGFRGLLVSAETALAMTLLISGGLFVRSFMHLQAMEPGFEPSNLMVARLSLPKPHYSKPETQKTFYDQLHPKIEALPGVRSVGVISYLPMTTGLATADFTVAGHPPASKKDVPESNYRMVNDAYFRTMEIPILKGREFNDRDNASAPPVVAVNETLAKKFFPNANPIGAQLMLEDSPQGARKVEIAAVVGNVKQSGLDSGPSYDIYLPIYQIPVSSAQWLANNAFWVVRTSGQPLALAEAFRRETRSVDADVASSNIKSMEQYFDSSVAERRFTMSLVAVFALAGLLLAAGGIYAVVSYTVSLRTREIAIRMTLGARRRDIVGLVVGGGMRYVAAGLAIGVAGAYGASRLISTMLFGVGATDPLTFTAIPLVLAAAAMVACLVPARRASNVLPMAALRGE